jgi:hypothetical protein
VARREMMIVVSFILNRDKKLVVRGGCLGF